MTAFAAGLLHPLLVPAHMAAVAALALLIGQQGFGRSVAIVYAVALAVGLGAIALAFAPELADEALLVATAITALLVALARPLPHPVGALLAAAVGLALALDSPPEAITLTEANLTLLGTAIGAIVALLVLTWAASLPRRDWQRIGARILGSWIAASAILVLALHWAR